MEFWRLEIQIIVKIILYLLKIYLSYETRKKDF